VEFIELFGSWHRLFRGRAVPAFWSGFIAHRSALFYLKYIGDVAWFLVRDRLKLGEDDWWDKLSGPLRRGPEETGGLAGL
jgi:hypothetical protein